MKLFSMILVAAALFQIPSAMAADRALALATATSAAVQEAERRVARERDVEQVRRSGATFRVAVGCGRAGNFVYDVVVRAIPFRGRTVYRAVSVTAVSASR